ncbi:MAG: ATP-binding protein [Candidatus Scalindua sp. AMX11]|nr:MAG: ATP-binding protein [Candidatus Scalindua sp.]NOG82531.1 Mrp/NBP35 family ATP-binding protein [Planctomycetota bacterium]RZV93961.1 MAG: ATP-binding protein [Candidatus Scalindua sp. SCAELEC01]TDE65581.1 MAG: ATP-binding protein [Candidatus Scalindua sp. AMX11]GJQ58166.1 MAG: iron-sulfur cluster carrier protein [Candidatus Scalindua sp.]
MGECKKLSTCEFCRDFDICKKTEKGLKHNEWALSNRMSMIKKKIMVMSNKGGVGKSTVTVNLGVALAEMGYKVGIADVDIHGPNIPKMLGVEGARLKDDENGIIPLSIGDNLKVVSMAFLIESPEQPVAWRDTAKYDYLRELVGSINWGKLDFLLADLPPGTGHEPITMIELMGNVDGTIIVTTPQDVALLDAQKAILFAKDNNVPIVGIVENMSILTCPHCNEEIEVFKSGGGEKTATKMDVPFLGRIPLDPDITNKCDEGKAFVANDSKNSLIFKEIVKKAFHLE